jgi:hypothetical protein
VFESIVYQKLAKGCEKERSKVMFVSRKVVFEKPLSKLFCVCLPLENVVNGKHFPVNEKHLISSQRKI